MVDSMHFELQNVCVYAAFVTKFAVDCCTVTQRIRLTAWTCY